MSVFKTARVPLLGYHVLLHDNHMDPSMTLKLLQASLPSLLHLRHEIQLRKDKSRSHMASPNKGTLTNSNTDMMPMESTVLFKCFLGNTDDDFNDS